MLIYKKLYIFTNVPSGLITDLIQVSDHCIIFLKEQWQWYLQLNATFIIKPLGSNYT